ncbi:outer membrane protein assembly factor BamE [Marinospirillum sp.]|uniref:outer membrane protein assembly factor BamE domain-containing protein n=1 Tax=Marinospirillum sp. TaxID=2183934 RepID=UPI002870A3F8|nr:outer membrane protein assembly factor BamE [Marinospirillum sp.]MDR9467956.1 outer membrane protein assembly factor BamE [Marinospirillum sp.]
MKTWLTLAFILLAAFIISGCASVGKPYAEHKVSEIKVGETTRQQVEEMFGPPWRTGLESGMTTWTYGHYRYSLFSDDRTSDLVVRYDENNKVDSYTYNRTTADTEEDPRGNTGP